MERFSFTSVRMRGHFTVPTIYGYRDEKNVDNEHRKQLNIIRCGSSSNSSSTRLKIQKNRSSSSTKKMTQNTAATRLSPPVLMPASFAPRFSKESCLHRHLVLDGSLVLVAESLENLCRHRLKLLGTTQLLHVDGKLMHTGFTQRRFCQRAPRGPSEAS